MIKKFVPSERKLDVTYSLMFTDKNWNGFAFACDKDGNVFDDIPEPAKANLEWCKQHPERFEIFGKVKKHENTYVEPAHGTCSCGEEVSLYDMYYGACYCEKCGQWYNMFGQEINPPSDWEEPLEDDM